jgi:hypothetical protein
LTEEELEAEPRRWVRSGSERATRVDDDGDGVSRRLLPGRANPEWTDPDRPVKLAPAVLPTVCNLAGACTRKRGDYTQRGVAVCRELVACLLESLGRQLDEARAQLLELLTRDADRRADQRKALFSLSKNPSCGVYVSASLNRSNSASSLRCSSVSRRGTVTFTSTRWSPRPNP